MVIIQCAEKIACRVSNDDLYPIMERRVLNNHYEIVDADCIDQACYALPDFGNDVNDVNDGNDDGVIIVNPTDTWENEFTGLQFNFY